MPVLAHLFYYRLTEAGQEELLKAFKECAGEFGAMETEYTRYSEEQRIVLREYAERYGLARSGGSDFHGFDGAESLCNGFPGDRYRVLLRLCNGAVMIHGTNVCAKITRMLAFGFSEIRRI